MPLTSGGYGMDGGMDGGMGASFNQPQVDMDRISRTNCPLNNDQEMTADKTNEQAQRQTECWKRERKKSSLKIHENCFSKKKRTFFIEKPKQIIP